MRGIWSIVEKKDQLPDELTEMQRGIKKMRKDQRVFEQAITKLKDNSKGSGRRSSEFKMEQLDTKKNLFSLSIR